MQNNPPAIHLNLDDAWPDPPLGLAGIDARAWGPRLRYIARRKDVDAFYREIESRLAPFILYGSGDFHHLAGALLRRVGAEPFTLISFDNHPDWDIRPPYWSCGGWAARTLRAEVSVRQVSVWGCGNFELQWPARLFADHRSLRSGRFQIHAWAERQSPSVRRRFDCMTRDNWRDRFETALAALAGQRVYVTIDMDCLRQEEAITNWENGLFSAQDIAWALGRIRARATLAGGDVCGAYSPPRYERFFQRLAAKWDHPPIPAIDVAAARSINLKSLETIWPALTGTAAS